MRRPLALCVLVLLVSTSVDATHALADTSQRSTEERPVAPTDRSSNRLPAAPGICVRYTVSVDDRNGTASLTARFRNKQGSAQRFVFCQMIGADATRAEQQEVCLVELDAANNRVRCRRSNRRFNSNRNGFHFGCREVSLPANGSTTVDYGSGTTPNFVGRHARDFLVTYADYIQLPAGATFDDDGQCAALACFGAGTTTGVSRTGGPDLVGSWYLPDLPFTDPFIAYQPLDSDATPIAEYRALDAARGLPSAFPLDVPQLERNVVTDPPSTYRVPLYLFDAYTMTEVDESFPASILLTVEGVPADAFETDPSPGTVFDLMGGELTGELIVNRLPSLQEGDRAIVRVTVHEPDEGSVEGLAYFDQQGTFIEDTVPPRVVDHSVTFDQDGLLVASLTATDATTGPLSAELWVSRDRGSTWTNEPLAQSGDVFEPAESLVFSGQLDGYEDATTIQYFFTVQDTVFNEVFFGVGTLDGPGRSSDDGCCNVAGGHSQGAGSLTWLAGLLVVRSFRRTRRKLG